MNRRPRVLYLAFFFPPSRASGVFRPLSTANYLADHGWDVTVHAAPLNYFTDFLQSVDPSMVDKIDPRIRVVRPEMTLPGTVRQIRDYNVVRAHFPTLWNKGKKFVDARGFPEQYRSWIPNVLRAALREHVRRPFDLVIATGNPFASFAAAWAFGRMTRTPYVLDYRDAWTFHQFLEEVRYPPGHSAWRWEKRTVEGAAEVDFVNQAMLQWHAERYPKAAEAMTVVPNGFEPSEIVATSPPPVTDAPLRYVYVGTITETMPIEELMEAWGALRKRPGFEEATLTIYGHLGFRPWAVQPLLDRIHDGQNGIRYAGAVAKSEVPPIYQQADVLLLWLPGGRYVTSGKVFEYMATGLPIASVHQSGIAAADVLDGYPAWERPESIDPAEITDVLDRAGQDARTLTEADRARAREHAMRFSRAAILGPFEERMRRIAGV
ncbi:MAG TPA: glycosyltransferase family 4 protein [Intrasporangiaceae bacterium]|nr:glycosyltransferase family 4 protein [Intrasporangiaceae bacterium]